MKKIMFTLSALTIAASLFAGQATVYTTQKGAKTPFQVSTVKSTKAVQPLETEYSVYVDPLHHYQTYLGFGGAITDAAAETFAKLPTDKQKELLRAYYDAEHGLGYNVIRTNMQACDFSSQSNVYVQENDLELKSFSIEYDLKYRIPLIKNALSLIGRQNALVYAAPWSPMAWMKDNKDLLHGGHLLPQYYQLWANCFVKFIKAYGEAGVNIWATSTQNEPMAVQTWESCIYTADEERIFIKNFLKPTLHAHQMDRVKIIIWDHNRDLLYQRAATILNDPEAADAVWGLGYHWYEDWTGSAMNFDNLRNFHEAFPDKAMVFTEGCVDKFKKNKMQDWSHGERYGYSIINDLNHGTCMWTDWNILLDEKGGPNHVGNYCFSPIHANTQKGELIYTNTYYYIGHFSKYIRPGAERIGCASSRADLLATAAQNSNGQIVVVAMNNKDKEIKFNLLLNGEQYACYLPAHSILTFVK